MKTILTNWKTTLAGVIGALIAGEQVIANDLKTGRPIPWMAIAVTFTFAVGLIFAKDASPNETPQTTNVVQK
jgi:hypothetical protein